MNSTAALATGPRDHIFADPAPGAVVYSGDWTRIEIVSRDQPTRISGPRPTASPPPL